MGTSINLKFSILKKCVKIIKNWYTVAFVYYRIYNKEFFLLNLKNGFKLKLRTKSTDIQAFLNVWLIEEYAMIGFEIRENDTIIDIGAHIGLFTVYASQFCNNGRIFSFEPIRDNYSLLLENIEINNLSIIRPFNLAVTGVRNKIKIYKSELDESAHTIYGKGRDYVEVDSVSLKEIIDSNSIISCDLLKLDCEGAEYEIMKTLPDEYLIRIRKICMEYHPIKDFQYELDKLRDRLDRFGFEIKMINYPNQLGLLFAKRSI